MKKERKKKNKATKKNKEQKKNAEKNFIIHENCEEKEEAEESYELINEEITELNNEIEKIKEEQNNIWLTENKNEESNNSDVEEDIEELEELEEINKEFLDTEQINDALSKKGKKYKQILNEYTDLKGNLNNSNNPFTIALIKSDMKNKLENTSNIESEHEENIKKNKYNEKPPIKFDLKNAKELNLKSIVLNEGDLEGEKDKDNTWYKKFIYLNKKYNISSKYNYAKNNDHVIYYCHYHWTTVESDKLNKKGEPLRTSKCFSRVYYYKSSKKYLMDWGHSDFCDKLNIPKYENFADIEGEITNYKNFKKELTHYLNSHPIIKYTEFKSKAYKFYHKNHCNFTINTNTFKNIYYNWRRGNIIFKKYSIFEYNKTINGLEYLRDYKYTFLYNKSGKSIFLHEHAIFCSDYFIKKLRAARHWYIDCTFVVPPEFKQLLVIMYLDEHSGKRYPGLYGLINNKKKEGYMCLFNSIKEIITIEKSKELSLYSYSVDYEQGLIDTCKNIFPNVRGVGCYYHYCKNLYKQAKKLNLFKEDILDEANKMLEEFYKIPFYIQNEPENYINRIYTKYSDKKFELLNEHFHEYINYFKTEWEPYIINGFLNYMWLKKEQRSNSYLENYNRRIKQKLSSFLYGKKKCRISWPLLIYFLIKEENEYRSNIYNNEMKLEYKNINFSKFIKTKTKIQKEKSSKIIPDENKILKNPVTFLKWSENSCRYDSFFFIYIFSIRVHILNDINNINNPVFKFVENISNILLQSDDKGFIDGIWKIFEKNIIPELDLTSKSMLYKQFNSINQPINLFKNIETFCIKYKVYEGCTLCTNPIEKIEYLDPCISISLKDFIDNKNLTDIINNRLHNYQCTCAKCGYDIDKIIINPNTYFKIFSNIVVPLIIFINFEFIDENEVNISNTLEEEKRNFEKRIVYNKQIIKYLLTEKELFGYKYQLIGTINTPQDDHYNGIILNLKFKYKSLILNKNYLHDGRKNNNNIIEFEDVEKTLEANNPLIGIYKKL